MNSDKVAKYIKDHCVADDYTLWISTKDSHQTRFAQNGITQHLAGPKVSVSLEVSFGTKSGSCEVNQTDEASLDFLIRTAEAIAKMAPENPEHVPSVGPSPLPEVQNCATATNELSPETMVDIVSKSIDKAKALNATVSGMCERHISESRLITKNGFDGSDCTSNFGHSMTLKKGSVETKVSYDSKDFSPFNLDEEFSRLASQAEALSTMQSFDPCKIAVILRPEALMELLWFTFWSMNRRQADEGLSPLTGQLGKAAFGEKFSMYSTLKRPEMAASRFGYDGIPASETTWVENGVIKNMNIDRYWAQHIGAENNSMFNVYVPGGNTSEEEMMKMVPRGLIINRFWYIRFVDMKKGELTGMTRDGVLYFEDGRVRHAVNNLRFNEIPYEMTRRILALGQEKLANSAMVVPTMLIDGFNFVDKTSF